MSTSSFVGHALTDPTGRFLDVDANFSTILERSVPDLRIRSILDLTHPDDRSPNHDHLETLRQTGRPFRIRKRYVRPSGEIAWVENDVSLFKDGAGEPRLVAAVRLLEVGADPCGDARPTAARRSLAGPLRIALTEALADALEQAHGEGLLDRILAGASAEYDTLARIANSLVEAHAATALDRDPMTRTLIEAVILYVGERLAACGSEPPQPMQ